MNILQSNLFLQIKDTEMEGRLEPRCWYQVAYNRPSINARLIESGLVTQSCPTLFKPMDCSLPGSSVHGILQTRILEWVPLPFSRASSWPVIRPRPPALQEDSLPSELLEKPRLIEESHWQQIFRWSFSGNFISVIINAFQISNHECGLLF